MSSASEGSAGIGDMIRVRLGDMSAQKSKIQNMITSMNGDLKRLYAKVPKKPRESMAAIDEKIVALEYKRTTSSMSLAAEKEILKEILMVEKAKHQLEEYDAYEHNVQEKKKQLASVRENLKTTQAALDELEAALARVDLAKRLSCTAGELRTIQVECPPEQVGRIIGRKGVTVKQIMQKTRVNLDVDSVRGKIKITGGEKAVREAAAEIERITQAVEELVHVSDIMLNYLLAKHISTLREFRSAYPSLAIEVLRNKSVIVIRGEADDVAAAKVVIEALEVASETRSISSQESGAILGKKGATVNRLAEDHLVLIKLEKGRDGKVHDKATVTVTGPPKDIAETFDEIGVLLSANSESTKHLSVSRMVRNSFLANAGASIKKLQKSINEKTSDHGGPVMLTFEKGTAQDSMRLAVRGRQSAVDIAFPLVKEAVSACQTSRVTVDVDPYVIPRIIGKGGATIRGLQNQYKGVLIELDKSGHVQIAGPDSINVEAAAQAVRDIADNNRVKRIDVSPELVKLMFRDLVKAKSKELNAMLSSLDMDEDSSQIVLRGTEENIQKAERIVHDFMEENFMEDVDYAAEDEPVLVAGGKDGPLNMMATETGVSMSIVRARYVVLIKGKKSTVQAAAKRLKQFLHGGDGFAVCKLSVTEQALGLVIGKGGRQRAEIEAAHEGISLFVHRSNRITIRGPEDQVEECRVHILQLISKGRVSQEIPITPEQHSKLVHQHSVRIMKSIPVQVTVTDDAVKVRGISADVKDAIALLNEHLTGICETRIELDASQITKVKAACRDPTHFERISRDSNTKIELDLSSSALVISGKREEVKKGKTALMNLLDFLLPHDFVHLKLSKPLYPTAGAAPALIAIAARSGASVTLDRDIGVIHVQSSDHSKVEKAVALLKPQIEEAEKNVHVVQFDESESWLIPIIIGKGGNQVNALRMETDCNIDVSEEDLTVSVSGEDPQAVAKASERLDGFIEQAKRECVIVDIPAETFSAFVGRSGQRIREFSERYNVHVERLWKERNRIKMTGSEDNVLEAKKALLEWIADYEQRHAAISMPIERSSIPAILGKHGQTVTAIQEEFECKVKIDRGELTLTVHSGTTDALTKAIDKIKDIIAKDKEEALNRRKAKTTTANNETEKQPPRDRQAKVDVVAPDSRKDRSSEFAPRPIGLAAPDPSKKGNRRIEAVPGATTAGRNLFELLVSDASPNRNVPLLHSEEQWDSSTASSPAGDNVSDEDGSRNGSLVTGNSYYKSASGFTVRI